MNEETILTCSKKRQSTWNKPCMTFVSPYTENLLNMGFSIADPKIDISP